MFEVVTLARAQEHEPTEGPAEAQVSHAVQESVGDAEEHGGFPPFEPSTYGSQLFWLVITFGLLYLLMSKLLVPRIARILDERANRIADDLATAERLRGETDAAIAAYEQELAEARQRAHAIALEARDRSKAETEAERKRLEADLNARMEEAEGRIAAVKERALADVDAIARDTAEALVENLLGPRATGAELAAALNAAKAEGRL